jgi:hypothetical protein
VGDDQNGAVAHGAFKRLLHRRFGIIVERRGRLVEQQDRRVADQARAIDMRWRWPPDSVDAVLAQRVS